MERFSPKQPNEEYLLDFDFEPDFTDPDDGSVYDSVGAIVSVSVINANDATDDQTSTMYDSEQSVMDGTSAKIWIKGGEDGVTYKITVVISGTTTGEIYEMDGLMLVREF